MSDEEEKGTKRPAVQIDQVKSKHDELSKKLLEIKAPAEILPDVMNFITEMRAMGRDVPPGANRDLLISLASYWATYYFQHSEENIYPATNLEPYLGPAVKGEAQQGGEEPAGNWFQNLPLLGRVLVIAAPLVLVFILAVVVVNNINNVKPTPTETLSTTQDLAGTQVAMDSTAAAMTEIAQPISTLIALASETAVAGQNETQTPIVVDTTTPQDTPIATQGGGTGIDNLGVTVQINNLNDLQEVPPQMDLSLSYANFSSGWSMHVLLQPLSQGLTYYPLPDYFLVDKGYGSGDWSVSVNFGTGDELNAREQYAVTPVMATSDAARQALADAVETGFEQLPEGVITAPQLVTRVYTVIRAAYTVINEVRVVYSTYPGQSASTDLFAMLPDGTDPLQLTDSPDISERHASVSPDGQHIVFVGRTEATKDQPRTHSLWITHTDGSNGVNIAQDPTLVYDRPLWSPDGKMIAYSTSPVDSSAGRVRESWVIYLYDVAAERTILVNTGLDFNRNPAWSKDGRSLYFSAFNPVTATLGLYKINLDTLDVTRVYDEKGNEVQPLVSPDGTQLLFLDYDSSQLYIMNLDTNVVEPVRMQSFLDLGYAVWSPDGSSLYFEVNVNSAYSIWTVNLNEPEPVQLTPGNTELDPWAGLLIVYLPK